MSVAKILLIDDNEFSLSTLKNMLFGYIVLTAKDGRTGLRLVMSESPDLILLDVVMPGLDGYSVLTILKSSEDTRHIPVALISAITESADREKLFDKGADDFITKPCAKNELRAKVKSLLRPKHLYEELQSVTDAFISMALRFYSSKPFFENHTGKTAAYAEAIARKRMAQPRDRERVKLAALLLDLGRLEIKDDILLMSAPFGPEEWQAVKAHPIISEQMCSKIVAFKPLLPLIRHHHERYDGKGYPDHLKGEEIPLGARILAVADSFDALTSDRPHRKAFSIPQALDIMKQHSGTQWDPVVVDIFFDLLRTNSIPIETHQINITKNNTGGFL
ncbi:MAG: response regulator [Firmicutes bacterium]|nr:response regulator [Bacillota bacterium]